MEIVTEPGEFRETDFWDGANPFTLSYSSNPLKDGYVFSELPQESLAEVPPLDLDDLRRKFREEVNIPQVLSIVGKYYPYQQELDDNLYKLTHDLLISLPFRNFEDVYKYHPERSVYRHHESYLPEELKTEVLYGFYTLRMYCFFRVIEIPVGTPNGFTTLGELFNQVLQGLDRKLTLEEIDEFRNTGDEADLRMFNGHLKYGESTLNDCIRDDLAIQGRINCNHQTRICLADISD